MTVYYSKWGTFFQNRDSGGGTRLDRIDDAPKSFWGNKTSRKPKGSSTNPAPSLPSKKIKATVELPKDLKSLVFRKVKNAKYGSGIIVGVDGERYVRVVFQKDSSSVKAYNRLDFRNHVIELVDGKASPIENIASEAKESSSDLFKTLGSLLYRCQRIEWQMKELLSRSSYKAVADNPTELFNGLGIDSWIENKDTLGAVVNGYLENYYGEESTEVFPDGKFGISIKISFNAETSHEQREFRRKQRAELFKNLVNARNWLAHSLGLEFDLGNQKNQGPALNKLNEISKVITRAESALHADQELFNRLISGLPHSISNIPHNPPVTAKNRSTTSPSTSSMVFDSEPMIILLKSFGFSGVEARAIYYVLDNCCSGVWIAGGFFGNEIKKYMPNFSYEGKVTNKQGKLFNALKDKGYIDLQGKPPYFKVLHL